MVYVFLANGFEEMEAIAPIDLLRRAGVDVTTVGVGATAVRGSHGVVLAADTLDSSAMPDDLEAVVLPGGMPGTLNLEHSPVVQKFIDRAVEKGAIVAAICAAPSILGHKGLLKGRKAVCYEGFEGELIGASVGSEPVAVDGPFITSRGAGTATQFALALLAALKGEGAADKVRGAILCP